MAEKGMDIEEYLREKRELEKKKEVLEAKTKLSEAKESIKKEKKHEFRPERIEHREYRESYREPALKPWMIWDLIILTIVIVLFSVSYFTPRYDESIIKSIARDNLITGQAVAATAPASTSENTQDDTQSQSTNTQQITNESDETLPGPDFFLSIRDKVLGDFDENGKLNGEILVVEVEDGYYKDLILTIKNGENEPIKCDIDKDARIDTNFDSEYDARDMGKFSTVELDPAQKKEIKDTIPGDLETGTYSGQGKLKVEYTAICYFCLDSECEIIENKAKSQDRVFFNVIINPSGSINIGNSTNSTS